MEFHFTSEYQAWLTEVKDRIVSSRVKAALSANSELIQLYYELGTRMVEREQNAKWGSGFIDGFSRDLKKAFPEMTGFSSKNLRYCRTFFRFYGGGAIWQQPVAKLGEAVQESKWQQSVAKTEASALFETIRSPIYHRLVLITLGALI